MIQSAAKALLNAVKRLKGEPINGKKLAELREKLCFPQESLGNLIGMSKNNLSRLENQTVAGMNKTKFRKLAAIADMTVEQLRARIGSTDVETPSNRTIRVSSNLFDALAKIAARDGITIQRFLEETVADDIDENLEAVSPLKPDSPAAAKREDIRGRDTVAANEQAG